MLSACKEHRDLNLPQHRRNPDSRGAETFTTRFYDAIGNILDTHRYGLSIGSCDLDWHTFTKTETSYKTYYK